MTSLFERITALVAIITLFPLLLLVALTIKLDSPGPSLFIQQRVGREKTIFNVFKFRTMSTESPNAASHLVADTHITRAGKFLRQSKIDELPQLINVIFGNMSYVGYRPCLPSQGEVISEREQRGVFTNLPGITGLAQINKIDMSTPIELAEFDAKYYREKTIGLYLRVLIKTVTGGGSGDAIQHGKDQA